MPVEAIDTTGAGDAFAGALAVAWNQGPGTSVALGLRRRCPRHHGPRGEPVAAVRRADRPR